MRSGQIQKVATVMGESSIIEGSKLRGVTQSQFGVAELELVFGDITEKTELPIEFIADRLSTERRRYQIATKVAEMDPSRGGEMVTIRQNIATIERIQDMFLFLFTQTRGYIEDDQCGVNQTITVSPLHTQQDDVVAMCVGIDNFATTGHACTLVGGTAYTLAKTRFLTQLKHTFEDTFLIGNNDEKSSWIVAPASAHLLHEVVLHKSKKWSPKVHTTRTLPSRGKNSYLVKLSVSCPELGTASRGIIGMMSESNSRLAKSTAKRVCNTSNQ